MKKKQRNKSELKNNRNKIESMTTSIVEESKREKSNKFGSVTTVIVKKLTLFKNKHLNIQKCLIFNLLLNKNIKIIIMSKFIFPNNNNNFN